MADQSRADQLAADRPARLHLAGISKRFGVVRALEGVSLTVEPGEVHALLGENGAGKSTLMRVLSGVLQPGEGTIEIDGRRIAPKGPVAARAAGIAMIHQEFQQAPKLTVAQNMFLGRPLTSAGGMLVSRGEQERCAREVRARLDPAIDPAAPIKTLKVAQRQIVEIARAVMEEAKIIATDEPTSSLTPAEFERRVLLIEQLARDGFRSSTSPTRWTRFFGSAGVRRSCATANSSMCLILPRSVRRRW